LLQEQRDTDLRRVNDEETDKARYVLKTAAVQIGNEGFIVGQDAFWKRTSKRTSKRMSLAFHGITLHAIIGVAIQWSRCREAGVKVFVRIEIRSLNKTF
jgi:hypothetical protein